jgi:hypothetical protein
MPRHQSHSPCIWLGLTPRLPLEVQLSQTFSQETGLFGNELYYENVADGEKKNRFRLPPLRHDTSSASKLSYADSVAAL